MKVVSIDEARRMARELGGELQIDKAPPAAAERPPMPPAAAPDQLIPILEAIRAQGEAVARAVERMVPAAPAPAAPDAAPEVVEEIAAPVARPTLAQIASARAPRRKHAYEAMFERGDKGLLGVSITRDGAPRMHITPFSDGEAVVTRNGQPYYTARQNFNSDGLVTSMTINPI